MTFDRHQFAWLLAVDEASKKAVVDETEEECTDYRSVSHEGMELLLDAANSALLDEARNRKRIVSIAKALTDNDRCVLLAMDQMQANATRPQRGDVIFVAAICRGDHKKGFSRLRADGLVDSRVGHGGGYWLTDLGQRVVEELKKTNSHTD